MFLYYVYYILTFIINFFLNNLLNKRLKFGKEHLSRYKEKLGKYKLKRTKGVVIWFHAASVGELSSIVSLVKEIEKIYTVLITTVTLSSFKYYEKVGFKNSIHQFAPLDTPQIVNSFIKHWAPDVGIFIDSEVWPNMLNLASKHLNLINLNARLSDKSAKRWGFFPSFGRFLYNKFLVILPCSLDDKNKISNFASPSKIKFIGNLKFATEGIEPNPIHLNKFRKLLKNKVLIVAASTHSGEEELILNAYAKLKLRYKNSFLIISPRHSNRGLEIKSICQKHNLQTSLRSSNRQFAPSDDVYITDTVGEMSLWYNLSDITFVGNSLCHNGVGHNIIEPAKLNNAIIIGPHFSNFKDIVNYFVENNAIVISNTHNFVIDLDKLLSKPHYRKGLADRALEISDSTQVIEGAKHEIFTAIKNNI